jgi:hypothetical protein
LGLSTSLGYLNTRLTTRNHEGSIRTNQDNLVFRWDGQSGVGYNAERFYTGFYAGFSGIRFRQENTTVVNTENRVFYHLFFGMRFSAPETLKRVTESIKNRVPIL